MTLSVSSRSIIGGGAALLVVAILAGACSPDLEQDSSRKADTAGRITTSSSPPSSQQSTTSSVPTSSSAAAVEQELFDSVYFDARFPPLASATFTPSSEVGFIDCFGTPKQRPKSVRLDCSADAEDALLLQDITWYHWDAKVAVGRGKLVQNEGGDSSALGTMAIQLRTPVQSSTGWVFAELEVAEPGYFGMPTTTVVPKPSVEPYSP